MDFFLDQNNLIVIFVAIASGVMLLLPTILKGGGKTVSVQEAVQLVNQKQGLFLDVRSHESFKTASIPQARNVPVADLTSKLASLPKSKPIIVVCDSGRDSARVAGSLRKQGYNEAVSLAGGLQAWLKDGMPVSKKA
ncbi:rhodanese-like domain-containing protein [Candidimonas sp. SYP-B2681]|uniref:rhodanese-like domain-containing protein n=1 Tax=Candidimonas sp. SYP-B2681 TaxID=2497686 RepID=UPI000F8759DB|nr:rhodanese-like domain-containing protein [Candidimonas sp. SYP-B2681]RTZ43137.1 rhodanese-like domain-containing protein [Candidimonas sp. SYP-B2681]